MSSSLNPTQIDPKDMPTLAPDVVLTRADFDVSKPESVGKTGPSAPKVGADATAGAAVPPPVDATFRAASTSNVKGKGARPSFGRRFMRVVVGMVLTACLAGAAVLWESRGDTVRQMVTRDDAFGQMVTKWAPSFVLTWLSRQDSPAADPEPAAPAVQESAVTPAPSAPQSAADNVASTASGPSADMTQVLQSMARDLADLREQMELMKASIADIKVGQDQMARGVARASEQNLRPRASSVSPVSPPPAQPVVLPARKPAPIGVRPVHPASPQAAAAYVPRQIEPRAVAPPPPSAAAPPPTDLSAPRPPAPLREQIP
jgi:hypothetical protein